MNNTRLNEILKELMEYTRMKKELEEEIRGLETEVKEYMTSNDLNEVFTDDMSIVARYIEVISNRFDTTAFKKSEWGELYKEYTKQVTSMRFSIN